MLTFGSLFSGIGGFDLGFEQAGMKCAWQCEIDKQARSVLSTHWPNITIIEDVRNVRTGTVEYVDLICGGFPCQDVSVAGKREGLAGKRSGLWFEFLRVLDELRPQWVVIENVPNLLRTNGGRDFATILSGLAGSGYFSAWRVLDAAGFGVPQQRKRLFIVGCIRDGSAARVLFETEPYQVNTEERKEYAGKPEVYAYKKRGGFGWSKLRNLSLTLESASGSHTGGNEMIPMIFDNGLPRWITPLEAERIAGFPDGWTAGQGKTQRYRQLGNAVVPQVVEWIGDRIVRLNATQEPKFVNTDQPEVGKPVTIGAKNNPIFEGVFTAV